MRIILSLLFAFSAQAFLSAETNAQTQTSDSPSSAITVRDSMGEKMGAIVCGGYLTFTVILPKVTATDRPTYYWTISAGQIINGQGMQSITVDSGPSFGYEITATVEIDGVSALSTWSDKRPSRTVKVTECLCPTISISCPTDIAKPDEPTTVSVN